MAFDIQKYHLITRAEDKRRFNIDDLEHYSLMMQLGEESFQVCITDSRSDACLLFEDYKFVTQEISGIIQGLKELFDGHNYLSANFWNSVVFSVKNNKFTFVPEQYFSEDHLQDYLKFGCQTGLAMEEYMFTKIPEIEAVSIFAVEKEILEFLTHTYIKVPAHVIHQSCALVKAMRRVAEDEIPININLERNQMQLVLFDGGSLRYFNQFKIKQPSELIRYVAMVANEFGMDIKNSSLWLWSSFPDDESYRKELNRYIKQAYKGNSPTFIKFSHEFDELADHLYLDVFGIYLCA